MFFLKKLLTFVIINVKKCSIPFSNWHKILYKFVSCVYNPFALLQVLNSVNSQVGTYLLVKEKLWYGLKSQFFT